MTPVASHELLVFGTSTRAVGRGVHFASQVLQKRFQARCFNVSCELPALSPSGLRHANGAKRQCRQSEKWIVARILDQTDKPSPHGSPYAATFATFEIYGPTVDDFDLYRSVQYLQEALREA
mmetsp:Transcript_44765/g.80466  ORF Transcript_44765/g.80466 Transcript_44765/m.80466 type:complete len:122 (+) Transcript_44765:96-461(+)